VARIDVACDPVAAGWSCQVDVAEGSSATKHSVSVERSDLERLDPGAADPSDLVLRSFEFLLEHEPKESILRSFDLTIIGRYFPDWEHRIRR
jgi:hypothetical protein